MVCVKCVTDITGWVVSLTCYIVKNLAVYNAY